MLSRSLLLLIVSAAAHAQRPRPIANFPGLTTPVALDTAGTARRVASTPGRVFAALRVVYEELDVPLAIADSVGGIIGNLRFLRIRTLGGQRLSRYLNCGAGMTGPLADNGRLQMAVASTILPGSGDSLVVRTAIVAAASSLEGASRDAVGCTTNGALELQVHDRMLAALARP
jgi:hypothetical protein